MYKKGILNYGVSIRQRLVLYIGFLCTNMVPSRAHDQLEFSKSISTLYLISFIKWAGLGDCPSLHIRRAGISLSLQNIYVSNDYI